MTREEIIKLAISHRITAVGYDLDDTIAQIEKFYHAAHAAGQAEMRERASIIARHYGPVSQDIRTLPIADSTQMFNPQPSGTLLYLAPPAPKVPEGWKLVPLKQTKEMSDAGEVIASEMVDANISKLIGNLGGHVVKDKYSQIATDYANGLINSVDGIYQAMVIAAPEYKETLK